MKLLISEGFCKGCTSERVSVLIMTGPVYIVQNQENRGSNTKAEITDWLQLSGALTFTDGDITKQILIACGVVNSSLHIEPILNSRRLHHQLCSLHNRGTSISLGIRSSCSETLTICYSNCYLTTQ